MLGVWVRSFFGVIGCVIFGMVVVGWVGRIVGVRR